jgi:hypothetical protein
VVWFIIFFLNYLKISNSRLHHGFVIFGGVLYCKHVTLVEGGSLFISSGLYSAANTGSSENTAAVINADGTVGTFGGATGSNTLLSVGGRNLFSPSGVSYTDASGGSHVLIIGGDNVNSPGARTTNVLYY